MPFITNGIHTSASVNFPILRPITIASLKATHITKQMKMHRILRTILEVPAKAVLALSKIAVASSCLSRGSSLSKHSSRPFEGAPKHKGDGILPEIDLEKFGLAVAAAEEERKAPLQGLVSCCECSMAYSGRVHTCTNPRCRHRRCWFCRDVVDPNWI